MSRIYETYLRRLEAEELTMAQCRQLCQFGIGGGHRTNLSLAEWRHLMEILREAPVRLPEADDKRGRDWLARYGTTRLGTFSGNRLPESYATGATHFTWDGSHRQITDRCAVPVWTAHLPNGSRFLYWTTPWQALTYLRGDTYTTPAGWCPSYAPLIGS